MLVCCLYAVAAQSYPLYAVAVQSKTHKGAVAIILFICRELPLKHLYLLYCLYLTYKTVSYSSNSIKNNLRLLF